MHPFVAASKAKLRFSANGQLSAEDLWDLPLTKLNDLAVAVHNRLKQEGEVTFIDNPDKKKAAERAADTLRLDVLKHVIDVKQTENRARKDAATRRTQRVFLGQLLEKKRLDALESLSTEDIEKQLAELGAEDED